MNTSNIKIKKIKQKKKKTCLIVQGDQPQDEDLKSVIAESMKQPQQTKFE